MFEFVWPWVFWILPLPWLIRWFVPPADTTTGAALKVPFFAEVSTAVQGRRRQGGGERPKLLLMALIWLLLIVAGARPQWLGEPVALPLSGRDFLLAVDISGSMETLDLDLAGREATRLAVVQHVAGDFIRRRVGDRLGLILFGSSAYLQTPLTFDRDTVRKMLTDAAIGLAGKQTAIGDAIGLAVKRLRNAETQDRVLMLLSDGANTAGVVDPRQAARLAAKEGLRIHTVGIGAEAVRVRGLLGTRVVNPSADLDEDMLREVADITGGSYFRATDTQALEEVYRQLDELEPQVKDTEIFRPVSSLYQWPLGAALLLSAILALIYLLPRRWLK
ncbi:MAG: VWA domain-containing protein, partial [Gammaproteobacteria bacterium]|nr:VWA domain-containing protein [Gammaproteobacteria bacterium]